MSACRCIINGPREIIESLWPKIIMLVNYGAIKQSMVYNYGASLALIPNELIKDVREYIKKIGAAIIRRDFNDIEAKKRQQIHDWIGTGGNIFVYDSTKRIFDGHLQCWQLDRKSSDVYRIWGGGCSRPYVRAINGGNDDRRIINYDLTIDMLGRAAACVTINERSKMEIVVCHEYAAK